MITYTDALETCLRTKESKSEWKQERKYRITGSRYSTYKKNYQPHANIMEHINLKHTCISFTDATVFIRIQKITGQKASKYFWNKEFKSKYTSH